MQISDVKLELFRYIDNLEKSKLLQIYQYLMVKNTHTSEVDFWDTLNDWQKDDIEAGLNDLEQGKKKNFDEVRNSLWS